MRYLALLRGINVGGKAMLPMADLKSMLEKAGYDNPESYIQSGNVFFDSKQSDETKIVSDIESLIKKHFNLDVPVALFTQEEWQTVISKAPSWWGQDEEWKHNLLVLIKPFNMNEVIDSIGELKPDIENMEPGSGVLYQSMSRELFGRTTTGKLASKPIYKRMTIRNYNTATRLMGLF